MRSGCSNCECFPPRRLLKIGVVIMTACTVLLVYIYGGSNSLSWSGLHTIFISDQSFDTVADSDKQAPNTPLSHLNLTVSTKQVTLPVIQPSPNTPQSHLGLTVPTKQVTLPVTQPSPATPPNLYLSVSDKRLPLEHVKLPADVMINASDIYISVLTMPRNHPTRFATHLFTWMQTVNPDQVRIITEESDDEMIKGAKQMGYHVVPSGCPDTGNHNVYVMCCKSGRQFEEYYRVQRDGGKYKWYCHADDDIYVNIVGLTKMLQPYDPKEKVYLGQWYLLQRIFGSPRVLHLAPGLLTFPERKNNNFVYSSGNTYCISDPLMKEVEKYLSGNTYVETCKKARVEMDDVLVGVVIDGILGYHLIEPRNFRTELDDYGQLNEKDLMEAATVSLGRVIVPRTKFGANDVTRLLSYHCLIYPDVSWCAMG